MEPQRDAGRTRRLPRPWLAPAAAILRRVVIDAARDGIEIVAPLHDAVLILAPTDAADNYAETICRIMRNASGQLLNGHEVRVAAEIFRDRFEDKDGRDDWNRVAKLLAAY